MVNIIINDNPQNDNNVDYNELLELVSSLKNDNKELIIQLTDLKTVFEEKNTALINRIDSLNNEVSILKTKLNQINAVKLDSKNDSSNENVKANIKHKNKGKKNTTNIYIPNKQLRTEWKNLKLEDNGDIINYGRRKFRLPISLNDLLYIIECDNKGTLERDEARNLMRRYHINTTTFGKIIYNIRKTKNFDSVLTKYKQNLHKARFTLKNGYICVNKADTNISMKTANEWIQILANTDKKQAKIIELQKANVDINPDMIRIICDSYDNPKLLKLLKDNESNHMFVENNPSKRRNIIANGGLL
jgi:hypothetical protein